MCIILILLLLKTNNFKISYIKSKDIKLHWKSYLSRTHLLYPRFLYNPEIIMVEQKKAAYINIFEKNIAGETLKDGAVPGTWEWVPFCVLVYFFLLISSQCCVGIYTNFCGEWVKDSYGMCVLGLKYQFFY